MGFEPMTLRVMTSMTLASPQTSVGVRLLLGSDFFCVLLWSILYISRYFLYNTNISGIGWLVRGSFTTKIELEIQKKLSKFYLIQP